MRKSDLEALVADAADALSAEPAIGTVIGERVRVLSIALEGNAWRGLVARVERRGEEHAVSLADVQVASGSPLHAVVARYRALLGLDGAEGGPADEGGGEPEGGAPLPRLRLVSGVDEGARVEVAVLAVDPSGVRCRRVDGGEVFTLRPAGSAPVVPGEIATVSVSERWRDADRAYAAGALESRCLDVARLGLVPLGLEDVGEWDPADHDWGEGPDRAPEWARAIIAGGPRAEHEMELVIPGEDPSAWDTDPIVEAAELAAAGDASGARALLMKELEADLRCLDAHAHLGNLEFERSPEVAIRHYEAGLRIGELSLGERFDGLLPWGFTENRPFLRCLHGYGLCLWRLGQPDAARAVFERMLWLNPNDNQGARFLLDDVRRGTWEEMEEREEAKRRSASGAGGRKRSRRARALPVDLSELAIAMEDAGGDHAWYLDLETGAVFLVGDAIDDEDLPVPRDALEDDPRFVAVEPEEPGRAYRDLQEFTATVKDRGLRTRLGDALAGKGAFGRFKRVLAEAPAERERWFAFRNERLVARAREWLDGIGVKVVEK